MRWPLPLPLPFLQVLMRRDALARRLLLRLQSAPRSPAGRPVGPAGAIWDVSGVLTLVLVRLIGVGLGLARECHLEDQAHQTAPDDQARCGSTSPRRRSSCPASASAPGKGGSRPGQLIIEIVELEPNQSIALLLRKRPTHGVDPLGNARNALQPIHRGVDQGHFRRSRTNHRIYHRCRRLHLPQVGHDRVERSSVNLARLGSWKLAKELVIGPRPVQPHHAISGDPAQPNKGTSARTSACSRR
jgi:hypothetical protein